uniref:UBC core domain-containing protein n=1 Tax=Ditylenchus dipsaci TaxID=166011 RepID=A0A915EGK9_9BILA
MHESNVPKLDLGGQDDVSELSSASRPSSSINFDAEKKIKHSRQNVQIEPKMRKLHYIFQEFAAVAKDPIEGIYVTPSAKNPLEWFGLLIVRAGIFCGGMFRFSLLLPIDFPDTKEMPLVKFDDVLFHPLINPKTNITDLSRYFPSGWQRERNHIYQILTATQSMFFRCKVETGHAANPEAAILLTENSTKFKQMARDAVRRSRTQIYDVANSDDPNAICFTPWNEKEMEPVKEYLIGKKPLDKSLSGIAGEYTQSSNKKLGYSWVDSERCYYMCDLFPTQIPNHLASSRSVTGTPKKTCLPKYWS